MKKSQIFLGVTAFFLAMAGAFATKAKAFTTTYYYFNGTYHSITAPTACTGGTNVCTYLTAGLVNHYNVYYTILGGAFKTAFKS